MQKRNSELELSSLSPWSKAEQGHINPTYRTSKNSNQVWGSKKIIHEVHSPLLTGVKESEYKLTPPKGKQELNLNLNERSAASIRDDNTLLDEPKSGAGTMLTATKRSEHQPAPGAKTLLY